MDRKCGNAVGPCSALCRKREDRARARPRTQSTAQREGRGSESENLVRSIRSACRVPRVKYPLNDAGREVKEPPGSEKKSKLKE